MRSNLFSGEIAESSHLLDSGTKVSPGLALTFCLDPTYKHRLVVSDSSDPAQILSGSLIRRLVVLLLATPSQIGLSGPILHAALAGSTVSPCHEWFPSTIVPLQTLKGCKAGHCQKLKMVLIKTFQR